MKTGSANSASSNTGEGCPNNCAQPAPRDMVRDVLAGRLPINSLNRRNMAILVSKLVARIKEMEQHKK